MMKFLKQAGLAIAILVASIIALVPQHDAKAQGGRGQDYFYVPRTINFYPDTNVTAATATASSNQFDRIGLAGVMQIQLHGITNATGQTVTWKLFSSPDTTNYTALPYALGTSNVISRTNTTYGVTNVFLTNNSIWLLPGTTTTPSIASAGFGTPYLAPVLYTNTNTITNFGNCTTLVGVEVSDAARYISAQATVLGTNIGVAADAVGGIEGN